MDKLLSNTIDLAWAGGFFDGEGCISIIKQNKNKKPVNYTLHIQVGQVDIRAIARLQRCFGGNVYKRKNQKFYVWQCGSAKAVKVLEKLAPYLLVKRQEAVLALKFSKHSSSYGGEKMTPEMFEAKEFYYNKMKEYKDKKYNRISKENL